jgi:hypothetical protein
MTSGRDVAAEEGTAKVFGRRQRAEVEPDEQDEMLDDEFDDTEDEAGAEESDDAEETEEAEEFDDAEPEDDYRPRAERPRPEGPWDVEDVDEPRADRIDFGGLLIPKLDGTGVQFQLVNDQVIAVTVIAGQSAVQLMAFAAPRTEGIWDEVRQELAAQITKQGGVVDETEGTFGTELRAQTPVPLPDGKQGVQLVRFIGVDGPRWFLRGVMHGEAAVHPQAATLVEQAVRETVVNRGTQAMAPHDQIPLQLPPEMREQLGADQPEVEQSDNPYKGSMQFLDPGPTITETR